MEAEYPFHTASLLLLMAVVAIRMYFSGYADAASGVKQNTKGEGSFRHLRVLLGLPLILAFLAYAIWPPLLTWSQLALVPEVRWSGFALSVLGIIMLIWVQKYLSRNFTGTVQIRPGGNVITTGPYLYVRHPMYLSFLLLGTGIFLLTANWLLGGGFLLMILIVMFVRTPIEERALLNAYGNKYAEYAKRTGKFLPKVSSFLR
ncbi:hypothetical protein A3D88_00235 [Candidatus Peribacteria bacterium RIFCSPHIGHO2_02_FULL_52_16]|nr:MAG: hypothetical protein A2706_01215 [Candidatus Peribacteria bacterium RIFCSPHIGHO2_01_FULL_51_35]OGJ61551.1 MAG: hypothetical protein A3D88_00235 [Candidatus Peribacteria bacterium RIFCSPHIGHO2_02_FULL_52_16]